MERSLFTPNMEAVQTFGRKVRISTSESWGSRYVGRRIDMDERRMEYAQRASERVRVNIGEWRCIFLSATIRH